MLYANDRGSDQSANMCRLCLFVLMLNIPVNSYGHVRICAGWSEPLLVAHTTLLEISCRGSFSNADLILYLPFNHFSVMSGRVILSWTSTKQGFMCLAQGHNTETPWGFNLQPLSLESTPLPLSHCAPHLVMICSPKSWTIYNLKLCTIFFKRKQILISRMTFFLNPNMIIL